MFSITIGTFQNGMFIIFKGFQRSIDFFNLNYYNWMKA